MKTTIDLPDELLIAAKKTAAERRTTLKEIVAAGIRRELGRPERKAIRRKRPIRWVTAKGGLAPGLDVSNREKMYDWIQRHR